MAAAARQGLRSSSSSKKLVECFYDVLSPYSWLGFEVTAVEEGGMEGGPGQSSPSPPRLQHPAGTAALAPLSKNSGATLFCSDAHSP